MAVNASSLSRNFSAVIVVVIVVAVICSAVPLRAQHPMPDYDLEMYDDPALIPLEYRERFPDGLTQLWLKALQRPDAELQRLVIDSIAIAHRRGVSGTKETVPRLLALLAKPNQSLDVSRAALAALIAMDAKEQAASMAAVAVKQGPTFSQIVEPALADWKSPVMKHVWLQRITAASASQTMMIYAIDGLAALRESAAADQLTMLLLGKGQRPPVRIAAARALGTIEPPGVVDLAASALRDSSIKGELRWLLAIELLAHRDGEKTVEVLKQIVSGSGSAFQARALERLFQIDHRIVDAMADKLLESDDVNVRRWCARAMIAARAADRIKPLATMLGDVNPSLRREVAAALIDLAEQANLREIVTQQTMRVLKMDQWQGCEQAAVVLAKLDHKPGGPRMVELLGHNRGEVQVSAAWALKQLAIKELLPDMLDHAESVYDGFKSGQLNHYMFGPSLKMAHLFVAFGKQRYRPAEDLLRKYLPKDFSLGLYSRAAAAWAVGMLYEDDAQEDLVQIFSERLADLIGQYPETKEMRRMSAVSLGRMHSESALPNLRRFASGPDEISRICYWAIEQITGEPPPEFEPIVMEISDWLLAPLP